MSLLLDALNRASKDKAALAAATFSKSLEPALESAAPKPGPIDQTAPGLAAIFTPRQQIDASRAEVAPDSGFQLAIEPASVVPPIPPALQAAAVAPTPGAVPNLSVNPAVPVNGPRTAQTILRATVPQTKAGVPRRLLALAALAVLLAAGLGSTFMGWWGDAVPAHPGVVTAKAAAPVALPAAASVAAAPPPAAASSPIAPPAPTVLLPPAVKPPARRPAKAGTTGTDQPLHQASDTASKPTPASRARPSALPTKVGPSLLQSSGGPSALELGYSALTKGLLQEAKQAYTKALLGNSEERDALLGLAYIAHQQGQAQEARAYYKRVLRQEPGNPVAIAGLLSLNPTGDAQEFGSQAREVAEQNPNSAAAQSMLGHSLVRQDRLADAQLAFQRAHLLEPRVGLHAFNLAIALDRLHNYTAARLYYERALTLSTEAGGQAASGVPHALVQERLKQLAAAGPAEPIGLNK